MKITRQKHAKKHVGFYKYNFQMRSKRIRITGEGTIWSKINCPEISGSTLFSLQRSSKWFGMSSIHDSGWQSTSLFYCYTGPRFGKKSEEKAWSSSALYYSEHYST
ncbi:hypothetical protein Y1Q_0017929 [Alligator mississippiensis]|uniref:Uncharacterized protein n=1 Tax=Alligator mississippiensis TaxID=8496 RepID=A0A151MXP9_ALLMI|nr:hypothetical protein Y1Q_0017929 [Alligator mississippiensis]